MLAVIFEVYPKTQGRQAYFDIAASLREQLAAVDGCLSIERFHSMAEEGKILSLSFWRDEESLNRWRNLSEHRRAQAKGRKELFHDYRIRVAEVVRDYSMSIRDEAPQDSRSIHE